MAVNAPKIKIGKNKTLFLHQTTEDTTIHTLFDFLNQANLRLIENSYSPAINVNGTYYQMKNNEIIKLARVRQILQSAYLAPTTETISPEASIKLGNQGDILKITVDHSNENPSVTVTAPTNRFEKTIATVAYSVVSAVSNAVSVVSNAISSIYSNIFGPSRAAQEAERARAEEALCQKNRVLALKKVHALRKKSRVLALKNVAEWPMNTAEFNAIMAAQAEKNKQEARAAKLLTVARTMSVGGTILASMLSEKEDKQERVQSGKRLKV